MSWVKRMASGGERERISGLESLSSLKLGWRSVDHQDTGLGSTAGTGQYTPSYARTRDMPTACMIRLIMPIERAQRRIERPFDRIDEAEVSGNWPEVKNLTGDVLDVDTDNIAEISYLRASRGTLAIARVTGMQLLTGRILFVREFLNA
ncbi:MAG: hypothetical protein OTJ98_08875 [Dehalococcoidia bacterium]|nr:hypothetical protein [Dehalococcoidia bacterium]